MNKIFIPAFVISFICSSLVYEIGCCEDAGIVYETEQNENNTINVILDRSDSEISCMTISIVQNLDFKANDDFNCRNEENRRSYQAIGSSSRQFRYSFKNISEFGDICKNFSDEVALAMKQTGQTNITISVKSNLSNNQILDRIKQCFNCNINVKMIGNSPIQAVAPSKSYNDLDPIIVDLNQVLPSNKNNENSENVMLQEVQKQSNKSSEKEKDPDKQIKKYLKKLKNKYFRELHKNKVMDPFADFNIAPKDYNTLEMLGGPIVDISNNSNIEPRNYKTPKMFREPIIDRSGNRGFITDQSSMFRTEQTVNDPIIPNVKMTWKHVRSDTENDNLFLYARLLETMLKSIIVMHSIPVNIKCNYNDKSRDLEIIIESQYIPVRKLEGILRDCLTAIAANGVDTEKFYSLQSLLLADKAIISFNSPSSGQLGSRLNGVTYDGFNSFLKMFEIAPNGICLTNSTYRNEDKKSYSKLSNSTYRRAKELHSKPYVLEF